MSKTQRKLENIIIAQREDIERQERQLQVEYSFVDTLMKQRDDAEKLHKQLMSDEEARHAAEKKAATEAATLKAIRNGFVPIEVLRKHVRQEYSTTHSSSSTMTDMTLMLRSTDPVDKAILAALLEKPKPKMTGYASGGYVGGKLAVDFGSDWHTHLHYNPSIITPGGTHTPPKVGDRVFVYTPTSVKVGSY